MTDQRRRPWGVRDRRSKPAVAALWALVALVGIVAIFAGRSHEALLWVGFAVVIVGAIGMWFIGPPDFTQPREPREP